MKLKLLNMTLALCLLCSALFCSCNGSDKKEGGETDVMQKESEGLRETSSDMGQGYIDSFIFIGESTTYHMKSRGVLSGGSDTKQVWSPKGGTLMLSLSVDQVKIVYPETGEELTFYEAAKRKKPKYVLMTFGLNGAVQNIKKGEEYYKKCYSKLIDSVLSASPKTRIILQSAFPVAENMDMSAYSVDLATLNRYIDTINGWTRSLASEKGCGYIDTSGLLKDKNGNLALEYQSGDGYHLNAEAYRKILAYLRTHKGE